MLCARKQMVSFLLMSLSRSLRGTVPSPATINRRSRLPRLRLMRRKYFCQACAFINVFTVFLSIKPHVERPRDSFSPRSYGGLPTHDETTVFCQLGMEALVYACRECDRTVREQSVLLHCSSSLVVSHDSKIF